MMSRGDSPAMAHNLPGINPYKKDSINNKINK